MSPGKGDAGECKPGGQSHFVWLYCLTDTIPGYSIVNMTQHDHARHTGQLQRLRRVEGQVRGLVRMVEEERYCVDILTQIRAARAALKRVEESVLQDHVEHCVAQAVRGGSRAERQAKVDELVGVLGRFSD